MGYIIIFGIIAFISFRLYQFAIMHDAKFAVVEDAKVREMISDLRANIDSDDLKNKTKVFLNELEASLLTHDESVKLMMRDK